MKNLPILGLAALGLGAMLTAAILAPPLGGRGRVPGPSAVPAPPTVTVEIAEVGVGSGERFLVTFPADDDLRDAIRRGRLVVQSDAFDLAYSSSVPGSVTLAGTTRHVTPCASFRTGVAVMDGGREAFHLDVEARVRRAFTVRPVVEGRRYALALAPGIRPPEVAFRSAGYETAIVTTGKDRAELVVTRTGPLRLPGGLVRLRDRASGDAQTVRLPAPSVLVRSQTAGSLLDIRGELRVQTMDRTLRDRPDVAVVLDPPGAYAIRWRGTEGGALALRLRPRVLPAGPVRIGFRRRGVWVELHEFEPDGP